MTSRLPSRWPVTTRATCAVGIALSMCLALAAETAAAEAVSFETADGQTIFADLYPGGPHAVVLAHGGVFDKESWSELAAVLVEAGLTALAFDFRGYGSGEPTYGLPGKKNDVLGAIEYLAERGYDRISLVGGSMGGQFALAASAETGRIDRLVLLAPGSEGLGAGLRASSTLFIVSEGDRMRESVEQEYREAPEPKRIVRLPGSAHAQHLFKTDQAQTLTELIVGFLTAD